MLHPELGARVFVLAAALALLASRSDALEIVVPAYFYPSPGSDWNDLNTAVSQVPITAIMNPGSGPGNNVDSLYTSAVGSFRSAGGRVIGYVSSSYANRPLQAVLDDIDKYAAWYDIDGIFVDEMTNNNVTANLDFYQAVYDHIKSIDPQWEVMGNPGTTTLEAYLTRPAADRLMVWENFGASYPSHTPSAWNAGYDSSRFVNLLHQLAPTDLVTMRQYVDTAVARNVGGVYFTDDILPNPWDRLPVFWDELVAKVAQVNNFTPGAQQTLSNPVAGGALAVDASRADWQGVTPFNADADDAPLPGPELDYQSVTLANDAASLFFRFTIDESANGPAPGLGIRHNVYLDVDQDRGTGFTGTGGFLSLGADYLIQGGQLYEFQGATQQTFSWGFVQALDVDASTTSDIELSLPRALVGDPDAIDLLLNAANSGTEDYYPNSATGGAVGGFFRYLVEDPVTVPGDYDGDGAVGVSDYQMWRSQYGSAGGPADGNGDGVVNGADYTIWRDAYQGGSLPASSTAPEPLAISYLLLPTAWACYGARNRSAILQPDRSRQRDPQ
ncbi:MAG: hypothetical protein KDA37_09365 [Planctomycetales bacterium]|nr:hypothetical protein [Planctomycetales bacterium]